MIAEMTQEDKVKFFKHHLRVKAQGCFLCKWIYQDIEKNGRVTNGKKNHDGSYSFPIEGRLRHLELEFGLEKGALIKDA